MQPPATLLRYTIITLLEFSSFDIGSKFMKEIKPKLKSGWELSPCLVYPEIYLDTLYRHREVIYGLFNTGVV